MVEEKFWITMQVRKYYYDQILPYVGRDKEITNPTRFITIAIKEKLEKLAIEGEKIGS